MCVYNFALACSCTINAEHVIVNGGTVTFGSIGWTHTFGIILNDTEKFL